MRTDVQQMPKPDVHGFTHVGRVRPENQDHFVVCSLGPSIEVWATSIPEPPSSWIPRGETPSVGDDTPLVVAVADGVGGGRGGEAAARNALAILPTILFEALGSDGSVEGLPGKLTTAVMRCHAQLGEIASDDPALAGMATTLTAWLGIGARAYVVQVGDSRCYRLRDGELDCLTKDQTMAQEFLDQGLIDSLDQAPVGWNNILTSALGSGGVTPAVDSTDRRGGDVVLVCSDGVMKHFQDSALKDILEQDGSARSLSRELVERGVEDGGVDNITAVVVREGV